jgi:large-conductance mechanosensitive channel
MPRWLTLAAGAVTINYGVLLNNVVAFLIVALAVFFLVCGINASGAAARGGAGPTRRRACSARAHTLKATRAQFVCSRRLSANGGPGERRYNRVCKN